MCGPVHALQVDVYPNGNKQHPGERMEAPLVFRGAEPQGGLPAHMQFVRRLAQHSRLRQEAQQHFPGSSLAIQRYIISPSAKGGLAFEDRPLSSSKYQHGALGCSRHGAAAAVAVARGSGEAAHGADEATYVRYVVACS